MKEQHQFPNPAIVSVSDGDIFIFSFAMNIPNITLQILLADNHLTYSVIVKAGATSVAGAWSQKMPKVPQDANVVIRVDKVSPDSFTTYLNGDLIATTKAYRGHIFSKVGVFYAGGVHLAIFDSGDHDRAEVFAEGMRNPAPNYLETWEMDYERRAIDGSDMKVPAPPDREKALEARVREVVDITPTSDREKALEAREKEVADREKEVTSREKEVAVREKGVAGREEEVANREKELARGREKLGLEKEKALEAREKALQVEQRYNDVNSRGADGKDEDDLWA